MPTRPVRNCPHPRSVGPLLHSVIVAPVTSTVRGLSTEVPLGEYDGIRPPLSDSTTSSFSPGDRFRKRIGRAGAATMTAVCAALSVAVDGVVGLETRVGAYGSARPARTIPAPPSRMGAGQSRLEPCAGQQRSAGPACRSAPSCRRLIFLKFKHRPDRG